jgi:hypothetical protein
MFEINIFLNHQIFITKTFFQNSDQVILKKDKEILFSEGSGKISCLGVF